MGQHQQNVVLDECPPRLYERVNTGYAAQAQCGAGGVLLEMQN